MIKAAIIDWETLSLKRNAKVLAVGMTAFDLTVESTIDELRETTMSVNITDEGQEDRDVDQGTVDWWAEQSDEAKADLEKPPKVGLKKALEQIKRFCEKHQVKYLIGNGSNFDNAILAHACTQHGVEYPVRYWEDMDLRTMKVMASMTGKANFPRGLTPHIAADDAIFEAMVAQTCWRRTHDR